MTDTDVEKWGWFYELIFLGGQIMDIVFLALASIVLYRLGRAIKESISRGSGWH